ncbi:MAG: ATP-binding cassette domain-containing protein [Fimbriimonadaceae bacterium]|nr:ATP-binding cassette domain-containing protein [Fimbriimonadaceae bacterium]
MSDPVISVKGLSKTFSSVKKQPGIAGSLRALISRQKSHMEAVKGVSFDIAPGELVGFLGPNGAGKTTTLKMLTGILHPTSGEASVLGYRPFDRKPELLRQIALVMGNKNQLWWDLPAWDSFIVLRELYGVPKADFDRRLERLLSDLQISDKVNTQVRKMSLGERMKCELVAALLYGPRVIFLDEPTIGLDLISQKRIRDFLKEVNQAEGSTMILTSHYMQDVQELCDRVIVIDHGTIIFDGTLDSLMRRYSDKRMLRLHLSDEVPAADLAKYGDLHNTEDQSVVIGVSRSEISQVTAAVLAALPVVDISIEEVSIDEVIRNLFAEGPPA